MAPFIAALFLLFFSVSEGGFVGVNYGRKANDLPQPAAVVQLLKSNGVTNVKLYDSDGAVLSALANSGIAVTVAIPNELLAVAASRPSYALAWVQRNVAAYYPATKIVAVTVGNEVFASPQKNLTQALMPAVVNVQAALTRLRLTGIKVASPMALTALQSSYPPSAGAFREDLAESVIKPMLDFAKNTNAPIMVNAYPFFAYEANANDIAIDYALFRPNAGVLDAGSGLKYYSLLDAQLDAVFAAIDRLGDDYKNVKLVVSETGWPSRGDANETGASMQNAEAYNGNLVRRVLSGNAGTPRRPSADIDVFLFALFNENQKPGPTSERNYGLFYPSEQKVYDIELVLGGAWQEVGGPKSGSIRNSSVDAGNAVGETWCVADAKAGDASLQKGLDYACGEGGADCKAIQPGADCYQPDSVVAHASYAFNSYYQKKGRSIGTCYFGGAAYVVSQPPKFGTCALPSRA